MRHDYTHPPDWASYTPEEKHEFYCMVRCQRQALKQDTPTARKLQQELDRLQRKREADGNSVSLESYR